MRATIKAKLLTNKPSRELRLFVAAPCMIRAAAGGMRTAEAGTEVVSKMSPDDVVGLPSLYFVDINDDPTPNKTQTVTDVMREVVRKQCESRRLSRIRSAEDALQRLRDTRTRVGQQIAAAEVELAAARASLTDASPGVRET